MSFFCNDTATTEIYTLSLRDALPILPQGSTPLRRRVRTRLSISARRSAGECASPASDHSVRRNSPASIPERASLDRKSTPSELQSRQYLVCRLLLDKKN